LNNQKSNFVYIYNPQQASFYISNGVSPLDTGVNIKTGKVWYKFGYYETLEVYSRWCTRNK